MRFCSAALFALLALVGCGGVAQRASGVRSFASGLSGIAIERDGVARHESSFDRSGGNLDFRVVEPGQTITLLDYNGAGIIRRFWVTIAPRSEPAIHRQAILRMYWDGEESPSVEVPIGDFFGVGFGQQVDFISLPLNQTSGGYNCYWPMPFHKSARWTLTNLSDRRIDAFYYNIDFTAHQKLPKHLLHFHAQWRRENPTVPGKSYTILQATGRGHFVGAAMFMQARRGNGLGFLEGDERIFIDDDSQPSIVGTGTEDYFSSGWYFDRGTYSAPYHGCVIKDQAIGRISAYRWHIEDAIPFRKSIRVTIEHGADDQWPADYSSVACWYQSEPHAAFPRLPQAKDLLALVPPPPMKIEGAIEAEDILDSARASTGALMRQEMSNFNGEWSGNAQLFWTPDAPDAMLNLSLPAPEEATWQLIAYFTRAPDYGIVQIRIGGQFLARRLDLFAPGVEPTGPIDLGKVHLRAGENPLTIQVVGKSERSSNYFVGIDGFVLKRAP
ncbi:glycoside hydrolase family 172 protein [Fontivita pretiosa]|uniref:glycoside hydrolase family 172 protein n=1 Tax=Fontivita pretiosa TaxID=2989684 RepID=UPI003D17AA5F